jgi:hypothetical protein
VGAFDKVCAILTIPVGVVFLLLGVVGFFGGSSAQFTLPPVLGGLPFFLGWAMSVTLIRFWAQSNRPQGPDEQPLGPYTPGSSGRPGSEDTWR